VNRFMDREDAGRRLADRLQGGLPVSVVVGAVPRGGLPAARPLADRSRAARRYSFSALANSSVSAGTTR
jgi:predicted phosphoribosyltransferase